MTERERLLWQAISRGLKLIVNAIDACVGRAEASSRRGETRDDGGRSPPAWPPSCLTEPPHDAPALIAYQGREAGAHHGSGAYGRRIGRKGQGELMPRVCTVCTHPDRPAIDMALVNRQAVPGHSGTIRTVKSAIVRHTTSTSGHVGEAKRPRPPPRST